MEEFFYSFASRGYASISWAFLLIQLQWYTVLTD